MVLFGYRVFESDYFFRAHNEPAINWKHPEPDQTSVVMIDAASRLNEEFPLIKLRGEYVRRFK